MKPPCELAVKEFLPSLRAAIVKELSEHYNLKQTVIADALGITQASVSQYLNVERAKTSRFQSIQGFSEGVKQIAAQIAAGDVSKAGVLHAVCDLCSAIRRSDQFCRIHQEVFTVEECDICKGPE
ncbi:MAG: hypothetical protein PVF58_12055 [Candidatus Methanofastidiosia archaeon]|jgi:predicted transcriptional regulator